MIQSLIKRNKVLVLLIDYDNDLSKLNIKTPLIGFKNVSDIAYRYAIENPEDSDVNALFAALKIYNEALQMGYEAEIAVVVGDERGGLKAVQNIRNQLIQIINVFKADGVIIVSDGGEDEKVIPAIQSVIPILYIKTVVVEQARSLEQTYILLWRFIRKVLREPRLARVAIGYPGILLVIFSILAFLNYLSWALLIISIAIGALMIYKGFNLELTFESAKEVWKGNPTAILLIITSSIVGLIAIIITWFILAIPETSAEPLYRRLGTVLTSLSWLYGLALSLPIIGSIVKRFIRRSFRIWRPAMLVVVIFLMVILLNELGAVLLAIDQPISAEAIIEKLWSRLLPYNLLVIVLIIILVSSTLQFAERLLIKKKIR